MRPPREAYVRCVRSWSDVEVITGVECRSELEWGELRRLSLCIIDAVRLSTEVESSFAIGEAVERRIAHRWPDRAYFVEVTVGPERDCYTQIFQPMEKP
jgi:hypothetical protein